MSGIRPAADGGYRHTQMTGGLRNGEAEAGGVALHPPDDGANGSAPESRCRFAQVQDYDQAG